MPCLTMPLTQQGNTR